jgi:hypothetical protein
MILITSLSSKKPTLKSTKHSSAKSSQPSVIVTTVTSAGSLMDHMSLSGCQQASISEKKDAQSTGITVHVHTACDASSATVMWKAKQ